MNTSVNNNNIESKKAKAERQERYNARCKELEAEALAQMPYKVGDTVKSRYGETGRVVEMHPEITGDIDSPHLVYEYDGKPTVNVVILDTDGKRHCAHWSVYTLEPASEIIAAAIVREQQDRPGHVNTSWATDYTPDDFQKLTSRYEIADEDRDIVGRRFHTGEGLWTIDVFVSDYAGNEAHALIYILTGEGEVRANVLSLDHLRATLTAAKGWHEVAA